MQTRRGSQGQGEVKAGRLLIRHCLSASRSCRPGAQGFTVPDTYCDEG